MFDETGGQNDVFFCLPKIRVFCRCNAGGATGQEWFPPRDGPKPRIANKNGKCVWMLTHTPYPVPSISTTGFVWAWCIPIEIPWIKKKQKIMKRAINWEKGDLFPILDNHTYCWANFISYMVSMSYIYMCVCVSCMYYIYNILYIICYILYIIYYIYIYYILYIYYIIYIYIL